MNGGFTEDHVHSKADIKELLRKEVRSMKITKFAYKDFLGTEALEDTPGKINVLLAGNGAGKSTYIKALRFALTGELPPGNVIRNGADSLYTLVEVEGNTIERIKGETSKTLLNCRSTTKKSLDEFFGSIGVKSETARVLTSSQVLGSMSAEELSKFILESGLIPIAVDIDKLISICPPISEYVANEMRSYFPAPPERIGIDDISEAYSSYYGGRRSISAELKVAKANSSGFSAMKPPTSTLEDLEKAISEYEAASDGKALSAYTEAVSKAKSIETKVEALEQKIAESTASEPDSERFDALCSRHDSLKEVYKAKFEAKTAIEALVKNTKFTLESIKESICPLHCEIECTADKSAIISKLNDQIAKGRADASALSEEMTELENEMEKLQAQIDEYNRNKQEYENKRASIEQVELLKNSIPVIPPEPSLSAEDAKNVAEMLSKLKEQKKYLVSYNGKKAEYERMKQLEHQYEIYNAMVELLSPKSGIQEAILGMAVSTIADECNKMAKGLGLPIELIIKADNGVRVLVKTKGNDYYDYNSLSNGEKAITELIVMDVLNKLTGFDILILDNLDSLDTNAFSKMLSLVSSPEFLARYDHIILAGVDHPDLVEEISKYDVHRVLI